MSIALERIETSGFGRVMKCACDTARFESTPAAKETKILDVEEEEDDWRSSSSTTTSSSIGRNSDDDVSGRSSDGGDCDENEVQSSYKGGGLDMMDSLEQVLPMRRGISSFYNGKSKSYTSLAEASCTSIKDIAKPENAYTRRRRNLLAINHVWDKSRNKRFIRPISSSKSTLALAVAMSSSESISSTSEDSTSTSSPRLPPLHPQTRSCFNSTPSSSPPPSTGRNFSNWRSYSLADVREYTTLTGSSNQPHFSLICDKTNSQKET
ncbi:hypothetical protein COLO4_21151 [Corchorus olitorius]|uniref:Uncharacterized protein n=1 Tax=Corchorus olitorius TaxID=93759 RepID=A0A1R3IV61_9ROSI|nr:hypothetical protein COLO4_21151 [Corchorus olitorius]